MKERVEDLGRLHVMIEQLIDSEVFDLWTCRNKDFVDYFRNLSEDHQTDLLLKIAYGLSNLKDSLAKCLDIADGTEYEITPY